MRWFIYLCVLILIFFVIVLLCILLLISQCFLRELLAFILILILALVRLCRLLHWLFVANKIGDLRLFSIWVYRWPPFVTLLLALCRAWSLLYLVGPHHFNTLGFLQVSQLLLKKSCICFGSVILIFIWSAFGRVLLRVVQAIFQRLSCALWRIFVIVWEKLLDFIERCIIDLVVLVARCHGCSSWASPGHLWTIIRSVTLKLYLFRLTDQWAWLLRRASALIILIFIKSFQIR